MTAEWVSAVAWSFQRKRLLQLREIALLLELVDDAEIEIVVHVATADVGPDRLELFEHAPGTLDRGRRVARHQALEIGVGRLDDFRIAGLELLRDHFLRLLLVGEREVGARDVSLDEAREGGAVLLERGAGDDDGVEDPRRVSGGTIDQWAEAALLGHRDPRLDQRGDINAPGHQRGQPLRAAADLGDGDVLAGEAELLEQDADGDVGLRPEGADAEGLALEVAHA